MGRTGRGLPVGSGVVEGVGKQIVGSPSNSRDVVGRKWVPTLRSLSNAASKMVAVPTSSIGRSAARQLPGQGSWNTRRRV